MPRERENDAAWSRLLTAKGIDLSRASFPIPLTMRDLKEKGRREPRLMLSMDSRSKWPAPLRNHGVFPLSVSGSKLFLVKGDAWFDFPPPTTASRTYKTRLPFRLVSSTIGKGENAHIMRLETSGFLREFTGSRELVAVSSGKRMAPAFEFYVGGVKLAVAGAQYEMDLQYESEEHVFPVEAKATHYESCAIRQVYFPYRGLGEAVAWAKPIRPLYVTYSPRSDDYMVRELAFRRRDTWESIHVAQDATLRLKIEEPPPKLLDLDQELLPSTRVPQADAAWKLEELPLLVRRGVTSASTVAQYFGFDVRQSSYYRDAAEILGLVTSQNGVYLLTRDGKQLTEVGPQARADWLARRMCRVPALNAVLRMLEGAGERGLTKEGILERVRLHAIAAQEPISGSTLSRRTQTLMAWLRYIGSRTGAIVYDGRTFKMRASISTLDQFDR